MLHVLLKTMLLGFSIAAPVGPIGLLCIRQSLLNGYRAGVLTGFGAASADGIYALLAGGGLSAVSHFLIGHLEWIRLVGGILLFYLGLRIILKRNADFSADTPNIKKNAWNTYITTFFLTLTNPMTMLSFIAVFAGLGVGSSPMHHVNVALLIVGVMIGSFLWWLLLSSVAFFRSKINPTILLWINYISGGVLVLFGIAAIVSGF